MIFAIFQRSGRQQFLRDRLKIRRNVEGYREKELGNRQCCYQGLYSLQALSLSMAWIDYRKTFDSTSHELLFHLFRCLAMSTPLGRCIKDMLPLWRTRFTITSELVMLRRGVFQGDSLSPLLFYISLLQLSIALKRTCGYMCGPPSNRRHQTTHLFYLDETDYNQSLKGPGVYTGRRHGTAS